MFPVVFHKDNYAVHSGDLTVSTVYVPTPRWNHLKAQPFLAIHSADEHHMIYSFSNTTSYSTFYAIFSSFRITLWSMWLTNRKTALLLSTTVTRTRRQTELAKNWKTWWENCAVPENIQFSSLCSFLHSYTAQFNLKCMGPFTQNCETHLDDVRNAADRHMLNDDDSSHSQSHWPVCSRKTGNLRLGWYRI